MEENYRFERMSGEPYYKVDGQTLTVFMPKELDQHVASGMCEELDLVIDSYQIRELIFDFQNTEFMDSSGIGVIIGRSRKLRYFHGSTSAIHLTGQIRKIFEASGLKKIVRIVETTSFPIEDQEVDDGRE